MTSSAFEILNVEQGTECWIQERLKRVTASQTPSLFGLSPYQTLSQLLEEKITEKEADIGGYKQYLFQKGHDAEHAARLWLESDYGFKFPSSVILSNDCPGLLASLDGFNQEQNLILEAKYMGALALEEVKQGKIKPHHQCQVQAQLLASGAKHCIYFATTTTGDSAILQIKPQPEYQDKIKTAVREFMADLDDLEKLKQSFLTKYRIKSQPPLKVLPSGAKDPFKVKAR